MKELIMKAINAVVAINDATITIDEIEFMTNRNIELQFMGM